MELRINGAKQLISKLQGVQDTNTRHLRTALNKGAAIVSARAKYRCPVRTGALRNSIHIHPAKVEADTVTAVVYSAKEYAPYVEFGTGRRGNYPYQTTIALSYDEEWAGQIAQPYLMPALLESKTNIQEIVSDAVRKAAIASAKGKA